MKALKTLVVVMGVLIVGALGVIVVTLIQRAGQDEAGTAHGPGAAAPSAPIAGAPVVPHGGASPPAFGETTLALPPGAEILETATGGGRIVLRIRDAGGGAALVVIDAATGRHLGLVRIKAAGESGRRR